MLTFYEFRKAQATALNESKVGKKTVKPNAARRPNTHDDKSVQSLNRVKRELKNESNNEDLRKRLDTVERGLTAVADEILNRK